MREAAGAPWPSEMFAALAFQFAAHFFLASESTFASKPCVALTTERQVGPGGGGVVSLPSPSPSATSWLHLTLTLRPVVSVTQGGRVRLRRQGGHLLGAQDLGSGLSCYCSFCVTSYVACQGFDFSCKIRAAILSGYREDRPWARAGKAFHSGVR